MALKKKKMKKHFTFNIFTYNLDQKKTKNKKHQTKKVTV